MLNIHLQVTIQKKWQTQNLKNFKSLKSSSQTDMYFQTSCCNLKKSEVGKQNYVWFFYYFYFERNYDVLKSKSLCFLLSININFYQNETESKWEIQAQFLRDEPCASARIRFKN